MAGPARLSTPTVAVTVGFALACGLATACTDGTTPDCSDAQCLVVSVVPEAGDAGDDGSQTEGGDATEPTEGGEVDAAGADADAGSAEADAHADADASHAAAADASPKDAAAGG